MARQTPPKKKPGARAKKKAASKGSQRPKPLKVEDLFVRRKNDGTLIPIEVPVIGLEGRTIKVLPTTIGSVKGMTGLDLNCLEWDLPDKYRYIRDHVVEPDMSEVMDQDFEDNFTLWDLDMVLSAAVAAGGPQRRKLPGKT